MNGNCTVEFEHEQISSSNRNKVDQAIGKKEELHQEKKRIKRAKVVSKKVHLQKIEGNFDF